MIDVKEDGYIYVACNYSPLNYKDEDEKVFIRAERHRLLIHVSRFLTNKFNSEFYSFQF